jgi:SPP1 gp7 family putative phage head morphogenesis protein
MTPMEKAFYERLIEIFAPYRQSVAEDILRGGGFDISMLREDLQELLMSELTALFMEFGEAAWAALESPPPVPFVDDVDGLAIAFASEQSEYLSQRIIDTTSDLIANVVASAMETPTTLEQMVQELNTAFGDARAERIAVTEVTRASAGAINGLQRYLQDRGHRYRRYWITNADELVCPICGPLNGKPEEKWLSKFPSGPPAHPNCRCFLHLKRTG